MNEIRVSIWNVLRPVLVTGMVVMSALACDTGSGGGSSSKKSSEANITALTVTIGDAEHTAEISGATATVTLPFAIATPESATVKSVSLSAKATGLAANDELTLTDGQTTVTITAEDGTTKSYTFRIGHPKIALAATQLHVLDDTASDDSLKMPSNSLLFDITTSEELSADTQVAVEFLLVKDGDPVPATLEDFRKEFAFTDAKFHGKSDFTTSAAYKSILKGADTTSLYLAYDSQGNYPLTQGTAYALYAAQPLSSDPAPVKVGDFTTGTPVDPGTYQDLVFAENPGTADFGGNLYITGGQFFVFATLLGQSCEVDLATMLQNVNLIADKTGYKEHNLEDIPGGIDVFTDGAAKPAPFGYAMVMNRWMRSEGDSTAKYRMDYDSIVSDTIKLTGF